MSKTITQVTLGLYKPPFKYCCGYILDAEGNTVADNNAENDATIIQGSNLVLEVRGWGRIRGLKTDFQSGAIQDEVGRLIALALTEYWERRLAEVHLSGSALPDE